MYPQSLHRIAECVKLCCDVYLPESPVVPMPAVTTACLVNKDLMRSGEAGVSSTETLVGIETSASDELCTISESADKSTISDRLDTTSTMSESSDMPCAISDPSGKLCTMSETADKSFTLSEPSDKSPTNTAITSIHTAPVAKRRSILKDVTVIDIEEDPSEKFAIESNVFDINSANNCEVEQSVPNIYLEIINDSISEVLPKNVSSSNSSTCASQFKDESSFPKSNVENELGVMTPVEPTDEPAVHPPVLTASSGKDLKNVEPNFSQMDSPSKCSDNFNHSIEIKNCDDIISPEILRVSMKKVFHPPDDVLSLQTPANPSIKPAKESTARPNIKLARENTSRPCAKRATEYNSKSTIVNTKSFLKTSREKNGKPAVKTNMKERAKPNIEYTAKPCVTHTEKFPALASREDGAEPRVKTSIKPTAEASAEEAGAGLSLSLAAAETTENFSSGDATNSGNAANCLEIRDRGR